MAEELHSLLHILLARGEGLHDEPLHDEPLQGDQRREEPLQVHDELLQHGDQRGGPGHGGGQNDHTGSCSHSWV